MQEMPNASFASSEWKGVVGTLPGIELREYHSHRLKVAKVVLFSFSLCLGHGFFFQYVFIVIFVFILSSFGSWFFLSICLHCDFCLHFIFLWVMVFSVNMSSRKKMKK